MMRRVHVHQELSEIRLAAMALVLGTRYREFESLISDQFYEEPIVGIGSHPMPWFKSTFLTYFFPSISRADDPYKVVRTPD